MQPGDPIVYWRTIHPKDQNDRGGVVGTGWIVSTDLETDASGVNRFKTRIHEFFEDRIIPRDEVISFAGIDRRVWQGAVLDLPAEQASRVDQLLQSRGFSSLFSVYDPTPPGAQKESTDLYVRRDDPERDHDALGRGPLALSLAMMFHEIWCREQGLDPFPARKPHDDSPGFLAHIDSPWGGGKTSFANLIARSLNPNLDGRTPEFLKRLYPDRQDMSGVFIQKTLLPGQLRDGATGNYKWARQARHPWIIVPFNAWLNQHVDPPWWSFYQTIRKTCFAAIGREGVPTVEQDAEGKYYTEEDRWPRPQYRLARLWLRELGWRLTAPKVVFQLGFAFVFLLVALSIMGKSGESSAWDVGIVISVLSGAGAFLSAIVTVVTDAFSLGRNLLGERVSLGTSDPFTRFRSHFARMMRAVERPVLVIVDDIDRCEPKFIVEMTRGLQTILKSPRILYLLLGDRNWIEQAFEIYHKDMKDIDVGPEHTFGSRFVEKAIQLSYVLPGIGGHKKDYVREILTGRQGTQPSSTGAAESPSKARHELSAAERQKLRERISTAQSAQEIDQVGAEALADQPAEGNERGEAYKRAVREEVVLRRAAQKSEVELAIRHRLQPLARFLPGNPRHIKRIINSISMYQNSILLIEENYSDAEFGGLRWRQLVIGVVLKFGYPVSWSRLVNHPDWADDLIAGNKKPSHGPVRDETELAAYRALSTNTNFVGLLSETQLSGDSQDTPVKTEITSDVVTWLNRIMPI
jgi:hypothetical protein